MASSREILQRFGNRQRNVTRAPGVLQSGETQQSNAAPDEGILSQIGFIALQIYLFFFLSRILEFLPNLRITLILNGVFLGAAVVTGGLSRLTRSHAVLWMMTFLGWMFLALPFSVWRVGSLEAVVLAVRVFILMACIVALTTTAQRCLRLAYTIGYAGAAAGLMGLIVGEAGVTERLALAQGSLNDPNGYATLLVVSLPFLWLRARNTDNLFIKAACIGITAPILITAAGTGSRTGLLALLAATVVLFLRTTAIRKAAVVVCGFLLVVVAGAIYPDIVLNRYVTLTNVSVTSETTEAEESALGSAAASSSARMHLFRRGIQLTLANPLLGVGPGMFAVAENEYSQSLGLARGLWQDTHNTFVQVSSETGIPGFILYMIAFVSAARVLWRLPRMRPVRASPEWESVARTAEYAQMAGAALLVGATFLAYAYAGLVFVLIALAVVLDLAVRSEFLLSEATVPTTHGPSARVPPQRSTLPMLSTTGGSRRNTSWQGGVRRPRN